MYPRASAPPVSAVRRSALALVAISPVEGPALGTIAARNMVGAESANFEATKLDSVAANGAV